MTVQSSSDSRSDAESLHSSLERRSASFPSPACEPRGRVYALTPSSAAVQTPQAPLSTSAHGPLHSVKAATALLFLLIVCRILVHATTYYGLRRHPSQSKIYLLLRTPDSIIVLPPPPTPHPTIYSRVLSGPRVECLPPTSSTFFALHTSTYYRLQGHPSQPKIYLLLHAPDPITRTPHSTHCGSFYSSNSLSVA